LKLKRQLSKRFEKKQALLKEALEYTSRGYQKKEKKKKRTNFGAADHQHGLGRKEKRAGIPTGTRRIVHQRKRGRYQRGTAR